MSSKRHTIVLILPAMLATGALLTACGSSDPASAVAKEQAQERQAEKKLAEFAACMREHGVNAETAGGPNGPHGIKISPGSAGSSQAAMEAAQKSCARYRPEPKHINLSPQQKVETEEQLQKFARCMREHGIKVDVSTAGGGIQIGIHASAAGGPNPQSPGFQKAQSACQKLLPRPPGGGPKGGPFAAKSTETAGPGAGGGSESGSTFPGG